MAYKRFKPVFLGLYKLFPLLLFFALFIGSGLYFSLKGQDYAFYQISASVAILPAIIWALCFRGDSIKKSLNIFLEGACDKNIITMCLIYLLAGAFAVVLQKIGSVASTVNFALHLVPTKAILPALFLIAALVSTSMGTSMGTIAAVGPIGVGIAQSLGLPLPLTMGTLIGGAMFGDNLSMISDTAIAATQIHGCSALEKFKSNLIMALPAMIVTVVILFIVGYQFPTPTDLQIGDYQLVHCLPYLGVLGLALTGMNVFVVLTLGILMAAVVGFVSIPTYSIVNLSQNIFDGYKSMNEILILALLMGGLGELIKTNGGFAALIQLLQYFSRLKAKFGSKKNSSPSLRGAESTICAIVSVSDICTANNTTAIILSGEVTKEIAMANGVSPARAATLVGIFSCVFQGILPYSAQVLMAGSLSGVSPTAIVPHIYYCYLLGLAGILAIIFYPSTNKNSAKASVALQESNMESN